MSIVWHVTGLCDIFSSEDYVNGFTYIIVHDLASCIQGS